MKSTRRSVLMSAGALSLSTAKTWAKTSLYDFSYLDDRLRDRVARGYFPGISVRIGRGETLLHEAHFGDGAPDKVVHVASAGKWVAVATIAALVDAGKLQWSDRVQRYLPDFTDSKGQATLLQLLSHTAGYPAYQPETVRRDDYQTLEEAVEHIVGLPATAAPGAIFEYGGVAMQVAGRMAEIASGKRFNDLFIQHIARPLSMDHSGFSPVSAEPGFSPMLGGAFYTCVSDYGRFLTMMSRDGRFKDRRVLSAGMLAQMQANHTRGARIKKDDYVESARGQARTDIYGLGQWREEVDTKGHPLLVSSPGWAGAYGWLDKAQDLWGAIIAKADVPVAVQDGYNTFLGSTIYAPMVRSAVKEARGDGTLRGRVPVKGGSLYYEERGTGRPLVLIHGHSLDRRMWDDQFELFSRRFRVIRYDLRGYGRSTLPEENEAFLHAEDLRILLDALGIDRARLVGLSLGAFVATDFLALHASRVVKAVMAGGDLFDVPGPDVPWMSEARAKRQNEILALKKEGQWAYKRRWYDSLIANAGEGRERLRRPLWTMIDEWQMWQPLHIEPRLVLGLSARKVLKAARPQAPILIIRGDREQAGFSITDYVNAEVQILSQCGHLSNMDRPEAFNAAVLKFLK